MNYIAHLHIAEVTNTSFAGNLVADFGLQPTEGSALYQGWALHQMVDSLVDHHRASIEYRQLERKGRRRFSGIIQDILMDYWLVRHWNQFSERPFELFAQRAVQNLSENMSQCPPRLQSMIESLVNYNWLPNLGTVDGVEKAIRSIQRRWHLGKHLTPFLEEIHEEIAHVEPVFLSIYPRVLEASLAYTSTEIVGNK